MSRRLKSLGTIMRLQDQELRTHASELVAMQTALGNVENGRAELQRMRVEECRVEEPAPWPMWRPSSHRRIDRTG